MVDLQEYMLYYLYIMYIHLEGSMPISVSTAEARKKFADIVNQVAYGKEPIVLTRRGQGIAALISMEELELLQQIEDHLDIEDAKKALADPGENIPAKEFWKQLGL